MRFQFHPYRALLALVGRGGGVAPRVAKAGKVVDPFKGGGSSWSSDTAKWFRNQLSLSENRQSLYHDYDAMDSDDIVSAALDLFAEDATQRDSSTGRSVWVEADNEEIETLGNRLLDRLEMEDRILYLARDIAKYGDHFGAILTGLNAEGRPVSVEGLDSVRPHLMDRYEDDIGRLEGFRLRSSEETAQKTAQSAEGGKGDPRSEAWDYVHFRIIGRADADGRYRYGDSLIRAARRVWKMLSLMEEALAIYRIRRAPDRLKWSVDVTGLSPDEAEEVLMLFRNRLRKSMEVNTTTGAMATEMDPLSVDEDLFLPVMEGSMTNVEVMTGSRVGTGNVLDVEYMRKRLFSCLRIPPAYMGFTDDENRLGKSSLADQDVRFARSCGRLQRALALGLVRLIKIDLILRGVDSEHVGNEFRVHLSPVSFLAELQRAEVAKVRTATVEMLAGVGDRLGVDKDIWLQYVIRVSGFPSEIYELVSSPDLSREERLKRMNKVLQESGGGAFFERFVFNGALESSTVPLKLSPEQIERMKSPAKSRVLNEETEDE